MTAPLHAHASVVLLGEGATLTPEQVRDVVRYTDFGLVERLKEEIAAEGAKAPEQSRCHCGRLICQGRSIDDEGDECSVHGPGCVERARGRA